MIIEIYTDGSYKNGKIGYGAVILINGIIVKELYGKIEKYKESRNITGEIGAVCIALLYCKKSYSSIKEVIIYYDYYGIEKWANYEWAANKKLSKEYVRFLKKTKLNLTFVKVKAHSGNIHNDRADFLSKYATE